MTLPTMAEAQAYIDKQGLHAMLNAALNIVIQEMPDDGATRMAELLQKAARDRLAEQRMLSLFAMADTNGNGSIDIKELGHFLELMGEPLDLQELQKAFSNMGGSDSAGINFKSFEKWYSGASAKGGSLSRKGDAAVERKSRASRASRASKEEGAGDSFDILGCEARPTGAPQSLEFRVQLFYPDGGAALPEDGGGLRQISPWHDVPLYPPGGLEKGEVHMIVEIPKWSRAKFEIATGEDFNPIKQVRGFSPASCVLRPAAYSCQPSPWPIRSTRSSRTSRRGGCANTRTETCSSIVRRPPQRRLLARPLSGALRLAPSPLPELLSTAQRKPEAQSCCSRRAQSCSIALHRSSRRVCRRLLPPDVGGPTARDPRHAGSRRQRPD